jgi:hypothetical protein
MESLNGIKYLYHATPSCYVKSIKQFGLGGKIPKQRFWDYKGTPYENITQGVFFATDEYVAESYVESSEDFDDMAENYEILYDEELEIVVFRVDIKDLSLDLLSKDENLKCDDEESATYFYNGVIPYDKLEIVELY